MLKTRLKTHDLDAYLKIITFSFLLFFCYFFSFNSSFYPFYIEIPFELTLNPTFCEVYVILHFLSKHEHWTCLNTPGSGVIYITPKPVVRFFFFFFKNNCYKSLSNFFSNYHYYIIKALTFYHIPKIVRHQEKLQRKLTTDLGVNECEPGPRHDCPHV